MKNISLVLCALCVSLLFIRCQKDEIIEEPLEGEVIYVDARITKDTRWTAENVYVIKEQSVLANNATIVIEPGTIIKSDVTGGIIVNKGSTIDAQGTASQPIILTSIQDSIQPGQLISPNLTSADKGLWPGVFILGDAPVSIEEGSTGQFYTLPESPDNQFGGDNAADNSGIFRYVSIRHAGASLVPNEEPSGLSLGGVGSGTVIEHIEIFASLDDGINIDGGTVNVSHILSSHYGDDGLDIDRGWSGTVDNYISYGEAGSDYALELDGGEGDWNAASTIKNASCRGDVDRGRYIRMRKGIQCSIENSYFFNFAPTSEVRITGTNTAENWINETLNVSNTEFRTAHLTEGNTTIATIFKDKSGSDTDVFETRTPGASIVETPTVGADKSVFADWTMSDAAGSLNEF